MIPETMNGMHGRKLNIINVRGSSPCITTMTGDKNKMISPRKLVIGLVMWKKASMRTDRGR